MCLNITCRIAGYLSEVQILANLVTQSLESQKYELPNIEITIYKQVKKRIVAKV